MTYFIIYMYAIPKRFRFDHADVESYANLYSF